jgi:hypothetical protein
MVCVPTKKEKDGDNAPAAAMIGAAHAMAIINGLRPRRSASATSGKQMMIPQRTTAAPIP